MRVAYPVMFAYSTLEHLPWASGERCRDTSICGLLNKEWPVRNSRSARGTEEDFAAVDAVLPNGRPHVPQRTATYSARAAPAAELDIGTLGT